MRDLELDREAPQTPSADARHAERAPENHQNPNLPYDLNPDHHLNHRRPLNEHHLNRPLNEHHLNRHRYRDTHHHPTPDPPLNHRHRLNDVHLH
jgi:hypothetical protein